MRIGFFSIPRSPGACAWQALVWSLRGAGRPRLSRARGGGGGGGEGGGGGGEHGPRGTDRVSSQSSSSGSAAAPAAEPELFSRSPVLTNLRSPRGGSPSFLPRGSPPLSRGSSVLPRGGSPSFTVTVPRRSPRRQELPFPICPSLSSQ